MSSADAPTDADDIPTEILDENVEISTGIDKTDDGFRVTRTAAFAELADEPKKKALDDHQRKNRVKYFDDLVNFDAELSGTVYAQSQSAASGIDVTHPTASTLDEEPSATEKQITKECRQLIRDLGLDTDGTTIFRNLIVHGNDISFIQYEEGEGIVDMITLPLRSMTILDDDTYRNDHGFNQGGEDNWEETITEADWYIINEGREDYETPIPAEDILHVALNRRSNWHKDHRGRDTFGVWGERRLEPVRYSMQAKQNTLANKVAMDDKLLAREYFYINVEELFGHITDPDMREEKAKQYARELRELVEDLEADQKPILPEEVTVEIEGPDGETARNMSEFIQTMNDSLQHALNYHVGAFGRDAGGTDRANKPAKEMSDNSVRHLRKVVKASFRRLFEIHTILRHEGTREVVNPEAQGLERFAVREDIRLPEVTFDPVDPTEQVERVRNAISLYEKGVADLNEVRAEAGLEPVTNEDIREMYWFKNPVMWKDDESEDALYKNQEPKNEQPPEEEPGGDGDGDGGGNGDGGDGDSSGNRRSYPTDSRESYEADDT